MKSIMTIIFVGIISMIGFSQSNTAIEELDKMAAQQEINYLLKKAEATEWAIRNGYPITTEIEGSFFEIQYLDEFGYPQYYKTDNSNAAASISTNKVYPGGGAGLNLTGAGIVVREWDAGSALTTHQEYGGRVINVDGAASHYHSTHVAGTIMASGVVASAKGMAYQANLRSRDWNNDVSEMATEAANGSLMSCHSYGYTRGWYGGVWYGNPAISTQEDYLFGFYDGYTQQWDQVARNAPYYLICKSAGNDRGDSGSGYPADGPYDCIGQQGVAKNILTVGAVEDIPGGYTNPSSVVMSSFSSWGPADDGRIKPDIVANGVGLYSTYNSSNTSYQSLSGTSMSTPSVTGSLALLQQHRQSLTGSYMTAATLKALVIHTADEAGPSTGPDYMFGWGLMNTKNAALKISNDQTIDVISEQTLSNGETYTREVVAIGTEPLKVTIVWTDVPGTPPSAQLDPITPMLVNDLDLKLTRAGNTYYPWKLNRDSPSGAATNITENNIDNVEVVYIASPVAGETYTIIVDHDGTINGGTQAFSMILSGIAIIAPPVANFFASTTNPVEGATVTFTDQSTNSPTSWNWSITPSTFTFVSGTSASSQNPQLQFNEGGFYSVTLTATNFIGSGSVTKTDYILVVGITVAEFTANNTLPGVGQTVNFTDLSSNNPYSWSWTFIPNTVNFADGTTSSSQNPHVQFTASGSYSVSLAVSNGASNDLEVKSNFISVTFSPVADFDADNYTPAIGSPVNFWDISLNNPTSLYWTFDPPSVTFVNGTGPNSMEPQVQFDSGGDYTVTLLATNASGSDSETKENFIHAVQSGLWTGAVSTDWSNGANWEDSSIPYSGTTVQIPPSPAGGRYPEINSAGEAVCKHLIIDAGSHLVIPENGKLTVNGTLINNAGNEGLRIKSGITGTGSLISNSPGIDATVERYLTNWKWHFIGIPVENEVAGVFHLPSGHSDIYLKTHIESTNSWGPYIVPVETPLIQGRGYECWVGDPAGFHQDEVIEFRGKLGAGNYSTGMENFYDLEYTVGHGLNLICNPYPSALRANINTWTKLNVSNKVYVWDPTFGNYRYWNGISGTPSPYPGFGTLTGGVIPEMQAFFVEATGSNPSLTIPQSSRVHSSQAYYKDSEIPANTLRFDITGNGYQDAMFISFNELSTQGYDTDYDVEKLYGLDEAPQLYAEITGKNLSINTLPSVDENLIIPIGFECGVSSTFTIIASGIEGFDQGVEFYLEDLKEGTVQNLNENPVYSFVNEPIDDASRFLLHFTNPTAIDDHLVNEVRIYSENNEIHILNLTQRQASVHLYDLMGRMIAENQVKGETSFNVKVESGTGYYLVKVDTGDQVITQKVFIQ